MKSHLLISSICLAFLFLSLASACVDTTYKYRYADSASYYSDQNFMDTNDNVIFVVYDNNYHGNVVYLNENEDRYPLNDYRNGYSYRFDQDSYSEPLVLNHGRGYISSSRYSYESFPNWLFNGKQDRVIYQDQPYYYYTYSDYMDTYSKKECYVNPPRDKLVYTKCP